LKNVQLYSIKNNIWIFVGCSLAWMGIQTLVLHRLEIEWLQAFVDSFISTLLLSAVSAVTITIYRFYQPGKTNRFNRFIYAIGIAVLYSAGLRISLSYIYPQDEGYLTFLEKSMPVRFITSLLLLSFITLLNWLWNILKDQKEQEERKNEAEQLVREAELVRLRQQLQPHFLFNSLNSISALVGTKPQEARKMIQQLSDFLRGTLRKDEKSEVLLQEELENLKLYLEIEKVRFGHRLDVQIIATEDCYKRKLPPLLLQPLVENAIKFGLYGTIDTVVIEIRLSCETSFLHVEVKNPFDTEMQEASKGSGFGITYIQRRLFLLYARHDLLSIVKKAGVFYAKLKIPQTL